MSNTQAPEAYLQQFESQGYCFPIRVLQSETATTYRAHFEALERLMGRSISRLDNSHLFFAWAYELATHPKIVATMKGFLGEEMYLHSTRIFCKNAETDSFVSWHQDGRYTGLNDKPAPSLWLALSESLPSNGCLRLIPGTHNQGKIRHEETYEKNNLLNHGEVIQIPIDENTAVDVVLHPGEMSVHHINTIHGSNANKSKTRRIGFAMSYVAPHVPAPDFPVVHVSGPQTANHFQLLKKKPEGDLATSLNAYRNFQYATMKFT